MSIRPIGCEINFATVYIRINDFATVYIRINE